jgi:hypothetical protein
MSCATFRIFSGNGSRASFRRISALIASAISVCVVPGYSPSGFDPDRPVGVVAQSGPCLWPRLRWQRWPRCVQRGKFGGHAFVINSPGLAHGFLCQTVGGEKLHGKSTHEEMFAVEAPRSTHAISQAALGKPVQFCGNFLQRHGETNLPAKTQRQRVRMDVKVCGGTDGRFRWPPSPF